MKQTKFSTLIDESVLKNLKQFSYESGKNISWLVTEAVTEYLDRTQVRPSFRSAMKEVLEENAELLQRLAK